MGVLLSGTAIFLILGVVSYFFVSVLYRNDKDSQAYVNDERVLRLRRILTYRMQIESVVCCASNSLYVHDVGDMLLAPTLPAYSPD